MNVATMLEPDTTYAKTDDGRGSERYLTAGEIFQLSQAVSLKRIADALTGGSMFTAPINSYGEGIGDAIQGQMVRGAAGINQYDR